MPSIVVLLGRDREMITVSSPECAELPPDIVFDSLNRVCDYTGDLARLEASYPGMETPEALRTMLDACRAPSMSVGDELRYVSDSGKTIRRLECASLGWDDLPIGGATDWRDEDQ